MGRPRSINTSNPNIIWKSNQEFRHDLFKLELSRMKKNMSYKENRPIIEEIEHCHFFHSITNKGTRNDFCQPVGGHFHKVETSIDDEGNVVAKCGPPLKKETVRLKTGKYIKKIMSIEYPSVNENTGEERNIIDDHTHSVVYLNSEMVSESRTRAQHTADRQQLAQLQPHEDQAPQPALDDGGASDDI